MAIENYWAQLMVLKLPVAVPPSVTLNPTGQGPELIWPVPFIGVEKLPSPTRGFHEKTLSP
jgi:hypothetical protein